MISCPVQSLRVVMWFTQHDMATTVEVIHYKTLGQEESSTSWSGLKTTCPQVWAVYSVWVRQQQCPMPTLLLPHERPPPSQVSPDCVPFTLIGSWSSGVADSFQVFGMLDISWRLRGHIGKPFTLRL